VIRGTVSAKIRWAASEGYNRLTVSVLRLGRICCSHISLDGPAPDSLAYHAVIADSA
jgi:hypothetical protein